MPRYHTISLQLNESPHTSQFWQCTISRYFLRLPLLSAHEVWHSLCCKFMLHTWEDKKITLWVVNMNHTCTGTRCSSWMEMEGEKSRSLDLSCLTQQTKIFGYPGAGSTSATHAQTHWGGEGKGSSTGACIWSRKYLGTSDSAQAQLEQAFKCLLRVGGIFSFLYKLKRVVPKAWKWII